MADTHTVIDYECGIDILRLEEWLRHELSLDEDPAGTFQYRSCTITLEPLPTRVLSPAVSLPCNHLHLEGPSIVIEDFCHLFTLQFLSAGG